MMRDQTAQQSGAIAAACGAHPIFSSNAAASAFARASSDPRTVISSPAEPEKRAVKPYSPEYYKACFIGGAIACGTTHTSITPLDVVKCNMQIDQKKYPSIPEGFRVTIREQGMRGLVRGWLPTFIGYSIQGTGKYGLYEVFKQQYVPSMGDNTLTYLAASASAEFFADIGLCAFEAVKVRVQTVPGFANGLSDGAPKIIRQEGIYGLFKGLPALWARQIPYTMVKFGTFENVVQQMYKTVVPRPKEECSYTEQLGVSFASGYIAGIACATISQPADNIVSKLNAVEGSTVGGLIKEIGWKRLFLNGLPLRIVMIGTLTGSQFLIYDAWKAHAGL